jgi:hypothetical protein
MRSLAKLFAQALALALWIGSNGASGIALELNPSLINGSVGTGFDVTIVVSGLQAASPSQIVSAYDISIGYDDTLLDAQSATIFDAVLGSAPITGSDLSTSGRAEIFGIAFDDDATLAGIQGDSITLARIRFLPLAIGTSSLQFILDSAFQLVGTLDVAGIPTALDPSVGGARVVVDAVNVPEPGVIWLIALAALAAVLLRRPRRGSASPVY